MNVQLVPAPKDKASYLLFTTAFTSRDTFFKMAVGETVMYDGDVTGGYSVMLVSEEGTYNFQIFKDQDTQKWSADITLFSKELLNTIGSFIEEAYRVQDTVYASEKN